MVNKSPKISIIMGIYNCQDTLEESIESIINQTYLNWELIICDDGSTDGSYQIAESYMCRFSEKIILLKNERNMGLSYTLNICLKHSSGEFIARQDGDDVSTSDRLEKLVSFLINNKEYSIVSTAMILFDENGEWGRTSPIERPKKIDFIKGTPFAHAASMVRSEDIKRIGGYRNTKRTLRVEDYDLWFRLYEQSKKGYNFTEALYKARDDRDAIQRRKYKFRINEAYVRFSGFRSLGLPKYTYITAFKPLLVGLVPVSIYKYVRGKKYKNDSL